MKIKLLPMFLFLMATSTQLLARPSLGTLEQKLDRLMNALVACPSNAPSRFVDNSDGTICDHETGLMWEKKAINGVTNLNNPRYVGNQYTWSAGSSSTSTAPDGTVFTSFLARLNGEVGITDSSTQLGGYSDWRLPTAAELQTISNCRLRGTCPGVNFANPVFAPMANKVYWSSTSSAVYTQALVFSFDDFGLSSLNKSGSGFGIRAVAVRGGKSGPLISITAGSAPPGPVVGPVTPPVLTPLP